jgi:nitrite reductase/ring-hydroxylating ferredoxin subunit
MTHLPEQAFYPTARPGEKNVELRVQSGPACRASGVALDKGPLLRYTWREKGARPVPLAVLASDGGRGTRRSRTPDVTAVGDALPSDGWHRALPSGDLAPGTLTRVVVAGVAVLLARLETGAVAATSPVCPHRGEDLSGGRVYMGSIDCPLHHYLYDPLTGANRYPANVYPADMLHTLAPLPLFPVKEEAGWIWVALG